LLHLLDGAMPSDPEQLWAAGLNIAGLAAARQSPHRTPYRFAPWLEFGFGR
jgi:hypothetical protein